MYEKICKMLPFRSHIFELTAVIWLFNIEYNVSPLNCLQTCMKEKGKHSAHLVAPHTERHNAGRIHFLSTPHTQGG